MVATNGRPPLSRNSSAATSAAFTPSTLSPTQSQSQIRRGTTFNIFNDYVSMPSKRFNTGLVFYTSPSSLRSEFRDFRKQEKSFLLGMENHFKRCFWGSTGWKEAPQNRQIVTDVSKGVSSAAIIQKDAMAFFRNVTMLGGN